ncbi:MAG TPA: baseplate J/gp47 family protein [Kofleriaceae bacterium]|nr:baseplate J/gp47 family protein [Kofleriaceae bacterium]
MHELHGFLEWLSRQLFADSAERAYLLRIAALYGISPVPAAYATGNVTATGVDGSSILAGTILRLDAAISYRVVTGQVIASGTATLPVIAVLAGDAANLVAGATVSFESPIVGVTATATVAGGAITGGVDEEGTEEVRDRLLLRLREPPEGGADQDYEGWALAVAGVTRAWVFGNELGLGTVVVRFVRDLESPIFPDAGEVANVQAALDEQRPITAEVTAIAPTDLPVAFTIAITPDNADTRTAVTAELTDLLFRVAEPGDGLGRGTVLRSAILTAVGIAEGVTDYTVTVPAGNVVPAIGELATRGAITWV